MIDPETLRVMVRYDPHTGELMWNERTPDMFPSGNIGADALCRGWNKRFANKPALTSDYLGYRMGCIDSQYYYAHRVAWALHYGMWPEGHIDHINGIRSDNRIENLRDVSQSVNRRNGAFALGASGYRGVRLKRGKWQAYGKLGDKQINIGTFSKIEDAVAARRKWAARHGFTDRHECA